MNATAPNATAPNAIASLAALLERQPVLSAWMGIPNQMVAGILAREEFDAVTLDMQHSAISLSDVALALPAIRAAGKSAVARIPVGEFQTASRLLDVGLSAIIAPMINTIADARAFASFIKYPPMGERSWGPVLALPSTGLSPDAYFDGANAYSLGFAMVETREALAIVDDILAVPGIDGIFVGPADLSIALSGGSAPNPVDAKTTDAIAHVIARTRAAGKKVAAYAHTGARARELVAMGMNFVAVESDGALLRAGAKAALAAARG